MAQQSNSEMENTELGLGDELARTLQNNKEPYLTTHVLAALELGATPGPLTSFPSTLSSELLEQL